METFFQDVRFAARTLLRRPALTSVAVLTLALGIGASTAVFSVVNAVLLLPPPFQAPDRLVFLWCSSPELARSLGLPDKLPASPAAFYDWRRQSKTLDKISLAQPTTRILTGSGEPRLLEAVRVSGDLFDLLGTRPLLGRTLQPSDDDTSGAKAAVLSYAFWRNHFGGDSGILGTTLTIDGKPVTVVGVMPAGFIFPRGAEMPPAFGFAAQPDLWLPLALRPEQRENRVAHSSAALARLKAGVTLAAAKAEMVTISERLARDYPATDTVWSVRVAPLPEQLVGNLRPGLLLLSAAVGLLLLIACLNVANLLLAQATVRRQEISVRTALGAGRRRMMRQLLTESLLLSLTGGALGLLFATWGLPVLARLVPAGLPVSSGNPLDMRVLGFTFALSLLAGALGGVAPALHMVRSDLSSALRGNQSGVETARGRRMLRALVVVETALAVLLSVGAGLLVRSYNRLNAVDPGLRPDGVLTLQVNLARSLYQGTQASSFFAAALEQVRALPGVRAAGAVSDLPMSGGENVDGYVVEGRLPERPGEITVADIRTITPGYLEAMQIPLRNGRLFRDGDSDGAAPVALVDESLARAGWPNGDPIGKRLHLGTPEDTDAPWLTVVGVVGNVRNAGLRVEPRPQLYLPAAQQPSNEMFLAVRTTGHPQRFAKPVRTAIQSVDRNQPITQVRTMEEVVAQSMAAERFNLTLLGLFAVLAVVLAAVGIYGVMSYSVAQRTRELGLRMALGAQRSRVLRLVVWEAGLLAALGLTSGLLLSLPATRLMAGLVFGVSAIDPLTLLSVSACLAVIALVAAYVPAQRATRVDPIIALRAD